MKKQYSDEELEALDKQIEEHMRKTDQYERVAIVLLIATLTVALTLTFTMIFGE